ncbi:hypothetical protein EVAR_94084_1 [Eumeta japonica]|uniref:Uncharacterized protein n=1 Tax=Eumeta variegata TaxID=151549 RepID=A0A4C1V5K6_EUMVA|nr:hypothetical protein EVAR_94084_1 [Eumeta japonica]
MRVVGSVARLYGNAIQMLRFLTDLQDCTAAGQEPITSVLRAASAVFGCRGLRQSNLREHCPSVPRAAPEWAFAKPRYKYCIVGALSPAGSGCETGESVLRSNVTHGPPERTKNRVFVNIEVSDFSTNTCS